MHCQYQHDVHWGEALSEQIYFIPLCSFEFCCISSFTIFFCSIRTMVQVFFCTVFFTLLFLRQVWFSKTVACWDYFYARCYEGLLAWFLSFISTIFDVSAFGFICWAFRIQIMGVCKTYCTACLKGPKFQTIHICFIVPCILRQGFESSHQ